MYAIYQNTIMPRHKPKQEEESQTLRRNQRHRWTTLQMAGYSESDAVAVSSFKGYFKLWLQRVPLIYQMKDNLLNRFHVSPGWQELILTVCRLRRTLNWFTVTNPWTSTSRQTLMGLALMVAFLIPTAAVTNKTRVLTGRKGETVTMAYHASWEPSGYQIPELNIRQYSSNRPFYHNNDMDAAGFLQDDQQGRFQVIAFSTGRSVDVQLKIMNVSVLDEGLYVFKTSLFSLRNPEELQPVIYDLKVWIPVGTVRCRMLSSNRFKHFRRVKCETVAGTGEPKISCFQGGAGEVPNSGTKIKGNTYVTMFWVKTGSSPVPDELRCCSHESTVNVTEDSCSQYKSTLSSYSPTTESVTVGAKTDVKSGSHRVEADRIKMIMSFIVILFGLALVD